MPTTAAPVPGAWVPFDGLSPAARQAVTHWTDLYTAEQLSGGARGFDWREDLLPTEVVIARVMACGDVAEDWTAWEDYHAWYLSGGDVPDHGASRWPVIAHPLELQAACGYLDDGWHRLHSYVRAGDTHIPVLRFRPHQPH